MGNKDLSSYKFGKYEILEELGRGGFGIVYHAFDTVLEVERAVKELYPNLVNDPTFVSRFRQEARVAARLDHPNLVPVHDFGQIDGKYYLAMGYMAGGSLKDLLRLEGKLEPKRAYEVLAQVCEGLEYAHARGIVHRDLKPGNILFDETDKARMADMGFAKVMSEGTSRSMSTSGGLVGTPAYMAPETWRNKPATPQTDIYSLGCILYEILTGKVLFEGESPAEIMTMHMIDGPQYDMDLSQEFRPVLDKALQRDPQERFVDVNALLTSFQSTVKPQKKEPEIPPIFVKLEPDMTTEVDLRSETKMTDIGSMEEELIDDQIQGSAITSSTPPVDLSLTDQSGEVEQEFETYQECLNAIKDQRKTKKQILIKFLLVALFSAGLLLLSWFFIRSIPNGKMTGTEIITSANAHQLEQIGRTSYLNKTIIDQLIWSADGKLLASASPLDSKIILWDSKSGRKLHTLIGHSENVNDISWSPNGKLMASASDDNKIIIWLVDSGARLLTLEGHNDNVNQIAWSPDGKTLASGSEDGAVILWDTISGTVANRFERSDWVSSIAWSPDGNKLALGYVDAFVYIWEPVSGDKQILTGHTETGTAGVWSPDGKYLATSGGWDGLIFLWDAENGEKLHTLDAKVSPVGGVTWSLDGDRLASSNGWFTVNIWDVTSGMLLHTLDTQEYSSGGVNWSQSGELLSLEGRIDGKIIIWNAESGENLTILTGHKNWVNEVVWSPDGKTLASGGWDGTIRFWGIP